ncbi:MAG TPA: chromosome segregation protein SMC, partial [Saprospiraceae bacterium]|nr:chromosome segregation protein SMC [Saprospiraceae bacterium]
MRLKSLELKGFKSFANDTLIHFDEDVIGVVGPNGSGKSNVVDAIRWVLGEQKGKELRLENMGDVIFNGTKKRKPAPVAQVAITFDNNLGILPSEYQEVVLSRHLYRSGESEYKLNGVTCRLKDIQSLLIDTGIGSNSYAIIALGMVDDILYDKDNARRKMFEQAAGVSKYKKRKHETMLKLKLTEDDLTRIDDILKEIQTNLEILEKQAKRTAKFFELKKEYKALSLTLGARNNFELKDHFDQSEKRIQQELDQYTGLEAEIDLLHAEIERLRTTHLDDEISANAFQRELNELVSKIRGIESEKSLADQKIVFIEQNKNKLELQILSSAERLHKLLEEIQIFRLQQEEQFILLNEHKQLVIEGQSHRDEQNRRYSEVMQNRETVNLLHQQFEKEVFDLEKNIAVMHHNADMIRNENRMLSEEVARLENEQQLLGADLAVEEEKKNAASLALAELEENEQTRLRTIRELESSLSIELDQLRQLQRTLDARGHEADLLKDMISNLEGFPESIKFLNKAQDWNVSAPLLSDLIYCDQQYRVIVEQILEPYLNYYVVDTWEEASRAVRLLNFAQKGRANFFILSEYSSSPETHEVDGLSPLLNHIEIEKGYEHLIRQLLNDVYVSTGSPLDYKNHNGMTADSTIIDQQALMMKRAGQLAGGSVGLFEGNRLGRKKHLEVLEKEIIDLKHAWHQLQSKVDRTQTQIANLQAIDNAADLQVLRSKVVTLLQSWAEINSRSTHLTERVFEVSERRNKNVDVLQETEAAALNAVTSLQAKKNEFSSYTVSLEQSEEQYFEYQQQVNEAESRVNELRLQEIHLANKLESIERELKYHQDQAEQLSQSSESQSSQIEHDTIELEQMLAQTASMKAELIALYEDKKSKEAKLTEAEQNYYQQRHEIGVADDKLKLLDKQRSNQQYLINEMKDQHNQLKYKMVAISERMQVEFGIRLEEITEEHLNHDLPFEELEGKVNRLRNRLENYGEINPLAIEAHEEIKTRFDTINSQRQDILSAKTSLLATITEIEETATGKFMEAFNQVRENFVEVFRSLF